MFMFGFAFAPLLWTKTVLSTVETCRFVVGEKHLKAVCFMANNRDLQDYYSKQAAQYISRFYVIATIHSLLLSFCFFYRYKSFLFFLILVGVMCLNISLFAFPSLNSKYKDQLDVLIENHVNVPKLQLISKIFAASIASGTVMFFGIAFISSFLFGEDHNILKMMMVALVAAFSGGCF